MKKVNREAPRAVTVSPEGAIQIPEAIIRRYGIAPGQELMIVDQGGSLLVVMSREAVIEQARGMLSGGSSLTAALLEDRRRWP
ncbi:MAG: AbrB/MazE/SpoVT family DNA-binding domain-containing protein [Acidobacteria bacterium]|nr:AbrB/MazE/SpoVT family DNA-binding domain-containing protein [Acidobacteriota bacterium]